MKKKWINGFKKVEQIINNCMNKIAYLKFNNKMYIKMSVFGSNCAECSKLKPNIFTQCGTPKSLIIILTILLVPFVPLFFNK